MVYERSALLVLPGTVAGRSDDDVAIAIAVDIPGRP